MISSQAQAGLEIRYSQFRYRWWDYADFPVTALLVGYTSWYRDYGITVLYGNSSTEKNTIGSPYANLSARIENLVVIGIRRRKRFPGVTFEVGFNYTRYRERVTGPNINDSNMDYGTGFSLSASHAISSDLSVKLSYDTYYKKQKQGYGYETTDANSVALVYDF